MSSSVLIPRDSFCALLGPRGPPKIPRDGTVTKDERRKGEKSEKAQLRVSSSGERESGEEGGLSFSP